MEITNQHVETAGRWLFHAAIFAGIVSVALWVYPYIHAALGEAAWLSIYSVVGDAPAWQLHLPSLALGGIVFGAFDAAPIIGRFILALGARLAEMRAVQWMVAATKE